MVAENLAAAAAPSGFGRMPTSSNQVRVFISSTFPDMHAERDHLVTFVFPGANLRR